MLKRRAVAVHVRPADVPIGHPVSLSLDRYASSSERCRGRTGPSDPSVRPARDVGRATECARETRLRNPHSPGIARHSSSGSSVSALMGLAKPQTAASRARARACVVGGEVHASRKCSRSCCGSVGGGGPCASRRVNQSGPRAFAFDCNGARGQSMVSAKRTFAATCGTLAGDILWLAVIAGVFAIIVLN